MPIKIKVLIADDEPEAREGLVSLLEKDSEIEIKSVCSNGLEALEQIQIHQPDLVYLDIQMPEVTGLDVLRSLTTPLPFIIFVTAYDQHALEAFRLHAIDYLLKPFTDQRFFESLSYAKKNIEQKLRSDHAKWMPLLAKSAADDDRLIVRTLPQKLAVKTNGKITFIAFADIHYIEADDYEVKIVYQQKSISARTRMKQLEEALPDSIFIRIHKSYIVNLQQITEVENNIGAGLLVRLKNNDVLQVSKSYKERLLEALGL